VIVASTLTPVGHKRHMQYLTSAPYFRGSTDRHVATLGQVGGGAVAPPPRWMLCPQTSHLQFLYTLIFHHQCH